MSRASTVGLATLLGSLALAVASAPAAGADPTSAASLRPVGTPLRIVLLPVRLRGQRAPTEARLRRLIRETSALMTGASFGRIVVSGDVAPPIVAGGYETSPGFLAASVFRYGVERAVARGVRFDGAVPVFVAASRTPTASYGSPAQVVIQGSSWSDPAALTHELGHVLGLDHALGASSCRRPFRPLDCATRPRTLFEYGDDFDIMGYGRDRFGAYSQAALGVATITDVPAGRTRTTLRPSDRSTPTLLRLRTSARDYLVESRASSGLRYDGRTRVPDGVEISSVVAAWGPPPDEEVRPRPLRLAATNPAVACSGIRRCLARQVFAPGRSLVVPGVFRIRVLHGRGDGRARLDTVWLDRSPPTVSIGSVGVVRPFGGPAGLTLEVNAVARGAGVLSVEVDQGGSAVRVAADDVPGLATRGQGTVTVPLAPGAATARVIVVDAAGNRSDAAVADLAGAPSRPAATITFGPPAGVDGASAPSLAGGTAITVSGVTDASFAGLEGSVSISSSALSDRVPVTIGSGGAFTGAWTPPSPGLYQVTVTVPVGRLPGGELDRQTVVGWFRA